MAHSDKQWEIVILLLVTKCIIVQKKARALFSHSQKKEGRLRTGIEGAENKSSDHVIAPKNKVFEPVS